MHVDAGGVDGTRQEELCVDNNDNFNFKLWLLRSACATVP